MFPTYTQSEVIEQGKPTCNRKQINKKTQRERCHRPTHLLLRLEHPTSREPQ